MTPSARNPAAVRETFTEFAESRDERLRNRLVEEHIGLARQLASRFTNRGVPYDDLVQVASMGLVKSVDRFDADRGVEFSTFATRTIIGELKRHFRDKGWAIRAPRRIQELYLALGPSIETLTQKLGRPPTVAEIAELVDASEESVIEAMEAGQRYRTTSIDAPDRQEGTLSSRLGEVDSGYSGTDDRLLLALSLAELPERERTIINLRFAEGLTQSEIAAQVGLSQMHVSRLLTATLAQLRASFEQDQ
jgi:RNA polymerase sigma-B factor